MYGEDFLEGVLGLVEVLDNDFVIFQLFIKGDSVMIFEVFEFIIINWFCIQEVIIMYSERVEVYVLYVWQNG